MKKTNKIILTIVTIALVSIVMVIIMSKTKAKENENTNETSINQSENNTSANGVDAVEEPQEQAVDEEAWIAACKEYWIEKLVSEGIVKNEKEDLFFFTDFSEKKYPDDEGTYQKEKLWVVSVNEIGETSFYKSEGKKRVQQDGKVEITDTVHTEIPELADSEQLLEMTRIPYHIYDTDLDGKVLIEEVIRRRKEKNPEGYVLLTDPEKALETLLPLASKGGVFTQYFLADGILEYTFSDGNKVYLQMYKYNDVWYPNMVEDNIWAVYPGTKERDLEILDENRLANIYLQEVTADTLREVKEVAEGGGVREEWYEKLENRFVFLSKAEGTDAALYGMYGGNGLVLRVGNQTYPIYMSWVSPHMVLPVLYAGDYDNDGCMEYAIKTHLKTGTGVSGDELCIVEIENEDYQVHPFERYDIQKQLNEIKYDYEEANHMLIVHQEDGEDKSFSLGEYLQTCLENGNTAEFKQLVFGDIESFNLVDGKWYYTTTGGIALYNQPWQDYDVSIEMVCPVIYNEMGEFQFGIMQFESESIGTMVK